MQIIEYATESENSWGLATAGFFLPKVRYATTYLARGFHPLASGHYHTHRIILSVMPEILPVGNGSRW